MKTSSCRPVGREAHGCARMNQQSPSISLSPSVVVVDLRHMHTTDDYRNSVGLAIVVGRDAHASSKTHEAECGESLVMLVKST